MEHFGSEIYLKDKCLTKECVRVVYFYCHYVHMIMSININIIKTLHHRWVGTKRINYGLYHYIADASRHPTFCRNRYSIKQ